MARKAQFVRPEPGFSLYEGRTRGKRIKYTFSDEEDGASDALSAKRSNRQSGVSTPAEPARPTITASGRQVKSRYRGTYGETIPNKQHDHGQAAAVGGTDVTAEDEEGQDSTMRSDRATRSRIRKVRQHVGDYDSTDGIEDESGVTSSGHEWNGNDDDEVDDHADDGDDDEEMDENTSEDELGINEGSPPQRTLVVSLRYPKPTFYPSPAPLDGHKGIGEQNGLSNQAPPPEANPFATPLDIGTPFADGLSSTMSNTTMNTGQHYASQDSRTLPSDKLQPMV